MSDLFSQLHPIVADLLRRGMAEARAGQTAFARRAFEQALALDPACGEALLWLAALAPDGETSLRYLARALEINPNEPRAHAGIRWARKRLKSQRRDDQATRPMRRADLADTQPARRLDRAAVEAASRPPRRLQRWQWALAVVVSACVVLGGGALLIGAGSADRVDAAAMPTRQIAQVTATASPTVPASWTPTPLPTDTATPTATSEPSATPSPAPTETPAPADTPIPLPTATAYVPPPTADLPPAGGDPSARWVDVNLTTQTVTAYEGDTPMRSMLASTGLWNTPTVTGQFHVYLRYDSQTMSGPGYYLPGVQWVQYFYQGYALHGTYWHNNFGQPMSHGCVNLTNDDASWLYQWADYGTLVSVHY